MICRRFLPVPVYLTACHATSVVIILFLRMTVSRIYAVHVYGFRGGVTVGKLSRQVLTVVVADKGGNPLNNINVLFVSDLPG